ncbi:MAG: (Fe-S)-binding protein [Bacteroidales bacterium]
MGCAGAFDERYKKVTRAFAKILTHLNISFAVLGKILYRRSRPAFSNEMLYQMQALAKHRCSGCLRGKKIITICPHCFNTLKNEYPDLGGNYGVIQLHTVSG